MHIAVPPLIRRSLTVYGLAGYVKYPIAVTGEPDTALLLFTQVQAVSSGMYSPAAPSALFTNQGFSLQVISRVLLPFFALGSIKFSTALIIAVIRLFVNRSIHVALELFGTQQQLFCAGEYYF